MLPLPTTAKTEFMFEIYWKQSSLQFRENLLHFHSDEEILERKRYQDLYFSLTIDDPPPASFNPNRRRSRAVLYGIQDHYKTHSRSTKLAKINKVRRQSFIALHEARFSLSRTPANFSLKIKLTNQHKHNTFIKICQTNQWPFPFSLGNQLQLL